MKQIKIIRICAVGIILAFLLNIVAFAAETQGQLLKDKFDDNILTEADKDLKEYPSHLQYLDNKYETAGEVEIVLPLAEALCSAEKVFGETSGKSALIWKDEEYFEWNIEIEKSGLYEIEIEYYPLEGKGIEIQRKIRIDGEYPFDEAQNLMLYRNYVEEIDNEDGSLNVNRIGNEVRPKIVESSMWMTDRISNGQNEHKYPFRFYLEKGVHNIKFEMLAEPMAVASLKLIGANDVKTYSEIQKEYKSKNYKEYSGEAVKIQSERAVYRNRAALRREYSGDLATEPYSYINQMLNIIGDASWSAGGSKITWNIEVPSSGLYQLSMHTVQNYNEGLSTYRKIEIDGIVPFEEMLSYRFKYDDSWYIETLSDNEGKPYLFYLEKGEHTLSMTVSLSEYQPSIEMIEDTLNNLSKAYRDIRLLTGMDIDVNYEYEFFKNIPDLEERFVGISNSLQKIYDSILQLSGKRPAVLNTIEDTKKLIDAVIKDDEIINRRIDEISGATTDLGDLISILQNQPLALDYFVFSEPATEVSARKVNFFNKILAFVNSFIYSFQADYNQVGISGDITEETKVLDVWVGRSTQWVEILDQLIEEDFTKNTGIVVTTNTIPASQISSNSVNALLLAIVCGNAPDAALGVASGSPVEFAIRGAAAELTAFEDFGEVSSRFVPQIFTSVTYNDKVYALPETMNFMCLFYRKDILSQLGLKVPTTWQQVYDTVIPTLSQNSMQFFYGGGFDVFLYQYGGKYFTEDGHYSAFDSGETYKAFEEWIELYTNYNVPVSASFFNRFRNGEMPIGIAGMGEYIQFSTIAPELYGKWDVAALPGVVDENGNLNNTATGITGTTAMIFEQSKNKEEAWEFLKWWTNEEIQTDYQRSLEAVIGVSARWASANVKAFEKLPWSVGSSEYFLDIIENSAVTPVVLGSPYVGRHMTNAFTRVITMGEVPRDSLEEAIVQINRELKVKNEEFGIYY